MTMPVLALVNGVLLSLLLATPFGQAEADGHENTLPDACMTACVSPYGEVLGASEGGIEAYSNCQSDCVVYEPNRWKGTYTGIKWQCVEYARRWLLVNKGAVYGDVDIAANIWDKIDHLTHVSTNSRIPLETHLNGSTHSPRVGDLLVYTEAFLGTGHVAVVTGVDHEKGEIDVGEQNYGNQPWPDDYARTIDLVVKDNKYWLLDGYLLGWKRIRDGSLTE